MSIVSAQDKPLGATNYSNELPRIPPLEPQAAMAAIQVKDGYRLELAAAEPLVRDPVAMSFDENGRLFVVEMCDYSEQDKEFLGNIRMLEDLDNDGAYDKSTLFAHHLSWPTGVVCYDGGVFVAAAPNVLYLKDTDGDGQSDSQRTIFTGFGRQNVQGLLNSFCWGLDNRIYCQTSSCGGNIKSPHWPKEKSIALGGRDFSFDPVTYEMRLESGGGQHGMCFDDWGRRFTCHNSDHLQMYLYADRYASANENVPLPPSRQSIAADGPQAAVYRISPVEPWRLVRTRLRVSGQSPGLIEGGGRAAGYFTSATGITIYRGDAFPAEMQGMAFVGDVGSNIVHRKKLSENGISMVGHRIDVDSEFIAATDIWFRPVQFANAPDGTLYIADLYREVIEHPRSLPEEIKQHLDLTSGRDRGRIYRVVPPTFQRPGMPKLGAASIDELIKTLEHKNGWHRDTASRLLFERLVQPVNKDDIQAAVSKLVQLATQATLPQAKLHALGILSSIGAGQGGIIQAMEDTHPRVRAWAIQLTESMGRLDRELIDKLMLRADDSDPVARLQAALTLGLLPIETEDRISLGISFLVSESENDAWTRAAMLNAIGKDHLELLKDFSLRSGIVKSGRTSKAYPNVAYLGNLVGKNSGSAEWKEIDTIIPSIHGPVNRMCFCVGLMEAMQARLISRDTMNGVLSEMPNLAAIRSQLIEKARPLCFNPESDASKRIEAMQHLLWDSSEADIPLLAGLIHQREPGEIQEAAVRALKKFQSPEVANALLAVWPSLSPKLRLSVAEVLFSRAEWIELLLERAGQGGFALSELEPTRIAFLRSNPKTAELTNALLRSRSDESRQQILEKYRQALAIRGDKERGKAAFAKSCSACHRVENVGYDLAPNLATFQFRGAEAILQNIVDPNREVNPQYLNYTIITHDDRIITGMIADESAGSVTLVKGENVKETVPRSDIAVMKGSKLSLMPEGLESQLDLQSIADLLTYLTTLP